MTPFAALQSLCGLSNREAADYLSISESAVEKYRRGAKTPARGHLSELHDLWSVIDEAAMRLAEAMVESDLLNQADQIEIGYPSDDYEAQSLGLPNVGAWRQMLARVIDELIMADATFDPTRIQLVPRGSTLATAAASDQH